MNKIAIIAGICGLVVGGTGGYLACHFMEKKSNDKAISDGIQKALDEIRGNQKQKIMENEQRKSNIINAIPHFNAVDIAKDIAKDSGYLQEDVKEPEGAPDDKDEPDSLPFEQPEKLESHNIWDDEDPDENSLTQEEYDAQQEPEPSDDLEKLDPTRAPYPITQDQYNNELMRSVEEGFWDKVTLIFFKDNVFAERVRINEYTTMSAAEIEAAIGKDNVKRFVEDLALARAFVRNNKLHIDYEIVRSPRSYTSAMHEDDEE